MVSREPSAKEGGDVVTELDEAKEQLAEALRMLDKWGVPGNLVGGDPADADHLIAVVPWSAVQETLHRWVMQPETRGLPYARAACNVCGTFCDDPDHKVRVIIPDGMEDGEPG